MIHKHPHKTFIWPRRKLDDEVSAKDQAMGKDSPCCILESWQKFFVFFCWLKLWSCVDISSIPANIELFFLLPRKVISETHRLERKLQELSMGLGPKKCLGEVSQQNMDGFDAILVQTFTCLGATTAREPWSRVRGCGQGMAACGIDHNFH